MPIEDSLWVQFQAGDRKAFSLIYSLYIDELFSYGVKLCSDINLVKDCVQDIFIDLFEHRNQLSAPRNIKYYLFKVLKRSIFRKLKKERRHLDLFEPKIISFAAAYNFEDEIINKEVDSNKMKLIARVLKELTPKQQEILYLRFTMGFNYLEISKIVQIDHNSVRKQVYRAIKSIRKSTTFKNHINIILFYSSLSK